jgi:hypothetical protein
LICQKLERGGRAFVDLFGLMVKNGHFKWKIESWKGFFADFMHALKTVEFGIFGAETFLSGCILSECLNFLKINAEVIKEFGGVVVKVFEG